MRLFNTDRYALVDMVQSPQLSTPLGNLLRTYAVNSNYLTLQQDRPCYRHMSRDCTVYQWAWPGGIIEELHVTFAPQNVNLLHGLKCQAIVARVQACKPSQTLDAGLSWVPGYHWTEGCGEPGEGLEARSWTNDDWNVVAGTEDSEYLAGRSRSGQWMPHGLAAYFSRHGKDVVQVRHESLSVHLPELEPDVYCQIQFVIASGHREDDLALWLAADQFPEVLLAAAECS